MTIPSSYSFTKYLLAKQTVDDRALNHQDPFVFLAEFHLAFDKIRDDPRFDAFLEQAGLPKIEIADPSSTP